MAEIVLHAVGHPEAPVLEGTVKLGGQPGPQPGTGKWKYHFERAEGIEPAIGISNNAGARGLRTVDVIWHPDRKVFIVVIEEAIP